MYWYSRYDYFFETKKFIKKRKIKAEIVLSPGGALFLVGAFSFKEKSPTITVASFFFRQTTELIACVSFFTETDKFTQAKFDQCKLTAKGPSPFRFLPFLRNLQNRKTPKGPPFNFFSALRFFFRKFLRSQKSPPFGFFDILQQKVW